MSVGKKVRGSWISSQQELFPRMDEVLGPVTGRYKKLLLALEMVSVERLLPSVPDRMPGLPLKHRATLARSFLAKMVFDISTTTALVERKHGHVLRKSKSLRRRITPAIPAVSMLWNSGRACKYLDFGDKLDCHLKPVRQACLRLRRRDDHRALHHAPVARKRAQIRIVASLMRRYER